MNSDGNGDALLGGQFSVCSEIHEDQFISIGDLLDGKEWLIRIIGNLWVEASELAAAIEQFGILAVDRFERLKIANEQEKAESLDLIERHLIWQRDPESEKQQDPRSPSEQAEGFPGNPYGHFGWLKKDLPCFSATTPAKSSVSTPALSRSTDPCSAFLGMEELDASKLTIAFVGDKSEDGFGANNLLEIAARKTTRRVPLATLELVDRRKGFINGEGAVLLGMAHGKKLFRTEANAAKMTRLRKILRTHLGLKGDPFEPYRKSAGWIPRFKIVDKRGAADERAKREAERRTDSFEELNERGDRFADTGPADALRDADNDDADEWLKNNDPNESA